MSPSLDDLLAAAYAQRQPGPRCWAARLTGLAAEFVRRAEELVREGKGPPLEGLRRVLVEELGLSVGASSVSRHFRGVCGCYRGRDDRRR